MHGLRAAPRTLLALLVAALALSALACTADGSSNDAGADDETPTTTSDESVADVADLELPVYDDPAVPIDAVAVDDTFGVLLPLDLDDEEVHWALSPRPDIAYVLARGSDVVADSGLDSGRGQLFEFQALGPGTFDLSFKPVRGMFGEDVAGAAPRTFTVAIDGDEA